MGYTIFGARGTVKDQTVGPLFDWRIVFSKLEPHQSARSHWAKRVTALLLVGVVASIGEAMFSLAQSNSPISLGFALSRLGGVLQLGGLAYGVWVLKPWG